MRVLITGITGFVGGHLAALCREAGHEVHGLVRPGREGAGGGGWVAHAAELTDPGSVGEVLGNARPDWLFHLAGASSVGGSFRDPMGTWRDNLMGTVSVLEAVRAAAAPPTTVVSLSGEAYGSVPYADLPVTEHTPFRPLSPYGASKAAADIACAQYHAAHALPVIRVRAFNQLGPGQDARFVLPTICRQIAEAEARGDARAVIELGNLDTRRDFVDVRDVAAAYLLLAGRGDPAVPYLAAAGRSVAIRELVERIGALARIPVEFVSRPTRRREGEQPDLYGSPERLAALGWRPAIGLDASLADTLDWWRGRV